MLVKDNEVIFKIVYYGVSNQRLHDNLRFAHQQAGGESDPTTTPSRDDRYEFAQLSLGTIKGLRTLFHLFTVPTRPGMSSERVQVMTAADGIVFVAGPGLAETEEAAARLRSEVSQLPGTKPPAMLVQLDPRDAFGRDPIGVVRTALGLGEAQFVEAKVEQGFGTMETAKAICKLVLLATRPA